MASIPIQLDPTVPPRPSVAEKFHRLAKVWEGETGYLSSMDEAFSHPAYQEIIRMGPEVVPLLLRDLEENHTHWFGALRAITGANPLSLSIAGNIPKMTAAWLHWAKEAGYQW